MSNGDGRRGPHRALVGFLAVALLATGCATTTEGTPQTAGDVSGLPVTHFQSGLKEDAPAPDLAVRNGTGSREDRIAASAIEDVSGYWKEHMRADFGQKFRPVKDLISYDPDGSNVDTACGDTEQAAMNAFYCPPGDSVAWDRGQLLPMLDKRFGPMAIVTVLGHEFGHAIQYRLGNKSGIDKNTSTIVKEQQADCFAGGYFRYMAEDKSPYFKVSTSDGLNQVLASMFFIRDEAGQSSSRKGAHGSAFDRAYAFQMGFDQGPKQCAGINQQNVDARVTERSFGEEEESQNEGDATIDRKALDLVKQSLDEAFKGAGTNQPQIVARGGVCPNGPSTPPASYCPESNTVNVDLKALAQLGAPVDRETEMETGRSAGMGDFAAFAEIASRYSQGIQKGVGAQLENANAGLRTSCLVGAWASTTDKQGARLRLASGDLDEAIAELLQPRSLIAADVRGKPVASGFGRVESLRKGFLEGSQSCTQQYG